MPQITIDQAMAIAIGHHQAGRIPQAEGLYRQILAVAPNHAPALHLLGIAAAQGGRADVAVELIGRAIAADPAAADYRLNLGNALRELGRLDEAVDAYRQALRLRPEYGEAYNNLGITLREMGKPSEALAAHETALGLAADVPEYHYNLGNALADLGRADDAIAAFRRAIQLKPAYADALNNLGTALNDQGKHDQGDAACRAAVQIDPDHAKACYNLANTLKSRGLWAEALTWYDRAVALRPNDPVLHSNRNYAIHFHPAFDPPALLAAQQEWDRRHAAPLRATIAPHGNDRSPDRPLRVGYVSPDFRNHSTCYFTVPLLSSHDHGHFQIYCYANVARADEITQRVRSCADTWRPTVGLTDAQIAERVRADRIDILVDLSMHMARGRPLVFARKPAPIQVAWLAYPGTTGLQTMDYRLTDRFLDPPGEADAWYVEQSIRLPDSVACYDPLATGPAVNPLPALAAGRITFGCLNNFAKVNDGVLEFWAEALKAVPNSRLLLLAPAGTARQRVATAFESRGISSARIEFVDRCPRPQYLAMHHRIDIALDTVPYNGHTTSLDALWMGAAVISMRAKPAASRLGLSVLSTLGLGDLVAQTPTEFAAIAQRLAGDLPALANLRATLRDRMHRSPLMDSRRFAANVEAAYRTMWRRWCVGGQ